jgi:hypothetical protein
MSLVTLPVLSRYMISYLCNSISSVTCMLWLSSSLNWSARYVFTCIIYFQFSQLVCQTMSISATARFYHFASHSHVSSDVSISPVCCSSLYLYAVHHFPLFFNNTPFAAIGKPSSPLVQERDDILETTLDLPEPRVLINSLSSNNKSSSFCPFTLFLTPPVSPPLAD